MVRTREVSDAQLLESARATFLAEGFGASTLEIARRAGVSEALLFKRFATKDALFEAAMYCAETPPWIAQLDRLAGTGDLPDNLIEVSLQIIDFFRLIVPRLLMTWSARLGNPSRGAGEPQPVRDLKALTAFLERERRLGRIRACDPEVVARTLLGALLHHVYCEMLEAHVRLPMMASRYVRELIGSMWLGLAPVKRSGRARRHSK